jgi:uncharacterized protein YndB with AHSA1/START domain
MLFVLRQGMHVLRFGVFPVKFILKLFGGLAVLIGLAVIAAFFFPQNYRVERTAVINAKPDVVFAQISDLKSWKNWSAWHERDPAMKLSYSEKTAGVGAWSAWESKTEGNGKMTITAQEPAKKLVYTLEFPDMHMVSSGTMEVQPVDKGVRVAWVSEGNLGMNPMHRWFGLFLDRMIGPDFDQGLAKLKTLAESTK